MTRWTRVKKCEEITTPQTGFKYIVSGGKMCMMKCDKRVKKYKKLGQIIEWKFK